MPTPADDQISLAEIVRTMKDFREEFRSALGATIRADVYRAEQATLRAELAAENASLRQKQAELEGRIMSIEAEKRQRAATVWTALVGAAIAVVMGFLNFKN
jgi:transcription elongation GreA/GreB family factor